MSNLFPLLLSPGVLQLASLASLLCLFNWRALIRILFVSVFTTCPSTTTKIVMNKINTEKNDLKRLTLILPETQVTWYRGNQVPALSINRKYIEKIVGHQKSHFFYQSAQLLEYTEN